MRRLWVPLVLLVIATGGYVVGGTSTSMLAACAAIAAMIIFVVLRKVLFRPRSAEDGWSYYPTYPILGRRPHSLHRLNHDTQESQNYVPNEGWRDSPWVAFQFVTGNMVKADMISAKEAKRIAKALNKRRR